MKILGIESSCDETAVAVVEDGKTVHSNLISSQIAKHAAYGGVIPELAAREHLCNIKSVMDCSLDQAGMTLDDIDAIAVTSEPGLLPALLVGTSYARGLAASLGKPIVGVNHLTAHIYGAFIEAQELLEPENYPMIALLVSGGHTQIIHVKEDGTCKIIGQTIDDASGEAYDKAAKILGLGYPGGPIIDKLAKKGNPKAYDFPRALTGAKAKGEHRYNFSFSGLKTALYYQVRDKELSDQETVDLIASYQEAIVDVLCKKTLMACEDLGAKNIVVAGGVACNSQLRNDMVERAAKQGITATFAPPKYCTDNAAMIAALGYHELKNQEEDGISLETSPRSKKLIKMPFL